MVELSLPDMHTALWHAISLYVTSGLEGIPIHCCTVKPVALLIVLLQFIMHA